MHPLESESSLIVYVDIKSPYAFVAIEPILAMERALDVQFDWRPLTLDIPSYLGSARKKAGKVVSSTRSPAQWLGVKYAYRDARRYAEQQGHILKGTEKIWDSSLANMGIQWVMTQQPDRLAAYFAQVYPPFWRRELDIEDPQVMLDCLASAGVTTHGLLDYFSGAGRAAHDQLQEQLHSCGIYGVPTFVFNEPEGQTILFGREHIPYVRWHLSGREGDAPDIAYELPARA